MSDQVVRTRLGPGEEVLLDRKWGPISTITWCSGNHKEAARFLKQKLEKIVEKNPWVSGCISGDKKDGHFLSYWTATSSVAPLFEHLDPKDSPLHRQVSFDELGSICVKAGLILATPYDPKQVLLKVSVVPCSKSPLTKFAVLFSLCHIVGDGHTFYRLYNMLMCDYEIEALVAERINDSKEQQAEKLGEAESQITSSSGFVVCMIRGLFQGMCLGSCSSKYRTGWRYFLVDSDKMKNLKASAIKRDGEAEYVSTNDVITSWYLSNCACGNGTMAINLRNRIDGHTDAHAGNYENVLYYRSPEDCKSAVLIRKSVQRLKGSPLPPTMEFGREDLAIASNWVSFAAEKINLPGCMEEAHLPISDISGFGVASLSLCIIFRYRPDQLAVGVFGTPAHLAGLADAPFQAKEPIG